MQPDFNTFRYIEFETLYIFIPIMLLYYNIYTLEVVTIVDQNELPASELSNRLL